MTDIDLENSDEALNALAQKALKQVRSLCRGNGAEKDSIQIKHFDGEIISVEAINHLELHPEVEQDRKKGRIVVGEPVENPAHLSKVIDELLKNGIKAQESRKMLANILLDRPDKGYAMHAEYFEVEQLKRTYCYHEPCQGCGGQAQVVCNRCGGKHREVCNKCHGRTMVPCNYCNGSGFMTGPDGKQIQCNRCKGHRQTACPQCARAGTITCRQCGGSGSMKCDTCGGNAFFTHIANLSIRLKTLFEIDRTQIPHPATKVIEDRGNKMVEKGQIVLQAEQVKRDDGGLAIQYFARFPFGELDLSVNGKPLKTYIFGYKGKIVKIPNFLDELVENNFELLQTAAAGGSSAASNIRKASHSRIIAQGLLFSLSMPKKKAVIALKKKFPLGASNDFLKHIILLSSKALANVTRANRFGGIAFGMVAAALIDYAYFGMPFRSTLAGSLQPSVLMAADFVLIPIGGFIGAFIAKKMAHQPLKKALGPLLKDTGQIKMSASSSAWISYVASAVVLFLTIYAVKMTGGTVPSWFPL